MLASSSRTGDRSTTPSTSKVRLARRTLPSSRLHTGNQQYWCPNDSSGYDNRHWQLSHRPAFRS